MRIPTILVTGCGGDIGLGIAKILRTSNVAGKLIGTDLQPYHAGPSIFDRCDILPPSSAPEYMQKLKELAHRFSVGLIIPASEPELKRFASENALDSLHGIPVIAANSRALEIGSDKLQTARLLAERGLPAPWCEIVGEGEPRAFPCILKKRHGSGSRGVALVDRELAAYYSSRRQGDIWQEYLPPDDQEYTCGLFKSRAGELRTIVFRRTLSGGATGKGEVVDNPVISDLLEKIASAVELRGSINVQLRLTENGPMVFEINPRFSSTVVFRHLLGYQDLLWSIADRLGESIGPYSKAMPGTRFYRTSNEVILTPEQS